MVTFAVPALVAGTPWLAADPVGFVIKPTFAVPGSLLALLAGTGLGGRR